MAKVPMAGSGSTSSCRSSGAISGDISTAPTPTLAGTQAFGQDDQVGFAPVPVVTRQRCAGAP
ncbi:hypothetical protein AR457_33720 [Streptomyces agglomeratus]|uniref:Uncharacterized protein n=1 Tax=Streptomyces agglomeratus TaxID=285458 RepID=A0A1E5PGM4_9ACTN|nr:hypothetical protein AS594_33570 [Streptomyces agglomeratus]OEJ36149.1 hypothetical protein AR457_35710 [Streptomyces agglomeratus]OEJ48363.1 hypothetical protein AR457_33720 [Streptomyces agglomeratus]